ncbi:MAG: arginine deiminase-related protein [Cyclobacteriaceae bacterium]
MNDQVTSTLLMVRPKNFHGNEQTAVNNYFQQLMGKRSLDEIQQEALREFDLFSEKLRAKGVETLIVEDSQHPETPDAVFPNNWISFHQSGKVYTYPMFAENRRLERRDAVINQIEKSFEINEVIRLESWENEGHFLEGTGSLVLDRKHKLAFVALSDRAHMPVIKDFQQKSGYEIITFHANQSVKGKRLPIYHTNVMMYVGESFAVVCMDSIDDQKEKEAVKTALEYTGKEVITISEKQVANFAGNGLQVCDVRGNRLIVMSEAAYKSLDQNQRKALEKNGEVIHSPLNTIEYYGGGSARCMMAEIFLRKK